MKPTFVPYTTIVRAEQAEFTENKSRFICHAFPCDTEEAALQALDTVRKTYRDATHNCFAYCVGANKGILRYSDDGEPAGTAGLPIADVINKSGVTNLCLVVTRYFGGILLGSGGLVRAYTKAASMGIRAAGIVKMLPSVRLYYDIPYPLWDRVRHLLGTLPAVLLEPQFGVQVQSCVLVRQTDEACVADKLTQLSGGKVRMLSREELVSPWPDA